MDAQTDIQLDGHTDGQTNGQTDIQMYGWTDRQVDWSLYRGSFMFNFDNSLMLAFSQFEKKNKKPLSHMALHRGKPKKFQVFEKKKLFVGFWI